MTNDFYSRFPKYPDKNDYETNAPSYYDDLARKQLLFEKLATRIFELSQQTEETIDAFQRRLDGIKEEMKEFFQDWLRDGVIADLIGTELDALTTDLTNRMTLIETSVARILLDLNATQTQLEDLETYIQTVLKDEFNQQIQTVQNQLDQQKEKIDTHVNPLFFNARSVGLVPDTDITSELQTVVDTLPKGATLFFEPYETYFLTNEILFTKDITLEGEHAIFEVTTPTGVQNIFKFSGEEVSKKTITRRYVNGALSVELDTVTDVKKGQTVLISSTGLYNTSRTNYRMGGYFSIENVEGNEIRLSQSMPFTFGVGSGTATIYNPITPIIKNLNIVSMKNTVLESTMGIRVEHSKHLVLKNVYVDGFDHNVLLRNHFNTLVEQYSTGRSYYEGSSQSYGLSSYTSTGFIIRQSSIRSGRHALTLTGFEPSFNTLLENCTFDNEKTSDSHSFDCHDSNHSLVMNNCHCNGALLAGRCDIQNTVFSNAVTKKVTLAKANHFYQSHYTFTNCNLNDISLINGTYKQVPEDTEAEYIGLISFIGCTMKNSILILKDTVRVSRIHAERTVDFKLDVQNVGCIVDDVTVQEIRSLDDVNIISGGTGKISNLVCRDSYFPARFRAIYLPVNDNLVLDNVRFTLLSDKEPSSSTVETGSLQALYQHVFMASGGGSKITGTTLVLGGQIGTLTGGTKQVVATT